MLNFGQKLIKITSFLGDIIFFYISLFITVFLRYQGRFDEKIWGQHWPIFSGLLILWLVIFYSFNLYDIASLKRRIEFYNNYFIASVINLIIGIIYFYILSPNTDIRPRVVLFFLIVFYSIFFVIWRNIVTGFTNTNKFNKNVLFIGFNPLINKIISVLGGNQKFGYNFIGFATKDLLYESESGLQNITFSELEKTVKTKKIDLLVISDTSNEKIISILYKTLPLRKNYISLTDFYEQEFRKVPLQLISHSWFLKNFTEGEKNILDFFKRLIDLIFSIMFGLVSLVLIPFIIIAIKADSRGKIIFSQKRVGRDNKIFTAYKFRSMYENSESQGPAWAKENDPRITKVGNFLRKTRLDEIPQLWNIFKGDMSFVGPRPEQPKFVENLKNEIPFYSERLLVKPGLTGWAQINFPYADSIESSLEKLQYDLYYIKHRSFIFDISIILKTINIIFKKGGR